MNKLKICLFMFFLGMINEISFAANKQNNIFFNQYMPGYSPIYQGQDPGAEGFIGVINYL